MAGSPRAGASLLSAIVPPRHGGADADARHGGQARAPTSSAPTYFALMKIIIRRTSVRPPARPWAGPPPSDGSQLGDTVVSPNWLASPPGRVPPWRDGLIPTTPALSRAQSARQGRPRLRRSTPLGVPISIRIVHLCDDFQTADLKRGARGERGEGDLPSALSAPSAFNGLGSRHEALVAATGRGVEYSGWPAERAIGPIVGRIHTDEEPFDSIRVHPCDQWSRKDLRLATPTP